MLCITEHYEYNGNKVLSIKKIFNTKWGGNNLIPILF